MDHRRFHQTELNSCKIIHLDMVILSWKITGHWICCVVSGASSGGLPKNQRKVKNLRPRLKRQWWLINLRVMVSIIQMPSINLRLMELCLFRGSKLSGQTPELSALLLTLYRPFMLNASVIYVKWHVQMKCQMNDMVCIIYSLVHVICVLRCAVFITISNGIEAFILG